MMLKMIMARTAMLVMKLMISVIMMMMDNMIVIVEEVRRIPDFAVMVVDYYIYLNLGLNI